MRNRTGRTRLVYCVDSFGLGGTELNAVRTAEALDHDRFKLSVIYLQECGPLRARYEALGIDLIHLPISRLYSPRTAAQGARLGYLLRSLRADVLQTHDLYTNIFAVPWGRLLGGCRVVASRRWWFDAPRRGLGTLNRWSNQCAHAILANSTRVAKLLVEQERVPESKVVVIPNFLSDASFDSMTETDRVSLRRSWGVPDDAFLVGSVGRLAPVKNNALLLRAAGLLEPDVHVVLVGDGPARQELEQLARELGIAARVHFAGEFLASANLQQSFDAAVLCSHSEGFPNSLIEAMASARPVIATRVGGVEEVVEDGRTGLFLDPPQPRTLAKLMQALRDDAARSRMLGEHARAAVRARFHQSKVVDDLSEFYTRLAATR